MNDKFYSCTPEELMRNSRLPLRVMESEAAMYEEIAEIMASTIEKKKGERCVVICPVGPIGQYHIFAEKVNSRRISLKNYWFINMDEYLTDDDRTIPYESPLQTNFGRDIVFSADLCYNGANEKPLPLGEVAA